MANEILIGLLAIGVFLGTGMIVSDAFGYDWRRAGRRIKCTFGSHAPDVVRAEVGGRNVQRCLYCDKVVREYEVTVEGAKKNPVIRRIY